MSHRIVLVGGGHAHVEVVRRWGELQISDASLTVVDRSPRAIYSGMVPGFAAGQYERDELEIDLRSLCARAGAAFQLGEVASIDPEGRVVSLASGEAIAYDTASLDIGSTVARADTPGVRQHALASRPIQRLVGELEGLLERARSCTDRPFAVHVVGGGAGGVELAFGLEARLRREIGDRTRVALVTEARRLIEQAPIGVGRRIEEAASQRGIELHLRSRVTSVREKALELEGGAELATDAVIWVTGPAALLLARRSALPVDALGFVRIRDTLQVAERADLFAVGDCAALAGMQRAGVYAVRAGPCLDRNLRARIAGRELERFRPQRDFLSLLNLGDGTALGHKWGVVCVGRWVLHQKDRIDRAFMNRYRG